jgi:hypothetical protein
MPAIPFFHQPRRTLKITRVIMCAGKRRELKGFSPKMVAHDYHRGNPAVAGPTLALRRLTHPWSPTGSLRAKCRHGLARAR